MRIAAVTVVAVVLAGAGCSSNYIPLSRNRVSVISQGGGQAYVRDGVVHRHGFLGSGLVRAVQGVPAAEQAANEYRSRLKNGLLATVGGLVCMGVAVGLAVNEDIEQDPYEEREVPTAAWIALGCAAISFGGLGYMITAEPYRWDAINIFNDSVLPAPTVPVGPPGGYSLRAAPPLGKKKLSLRMRDD